MLHGTYPHSNPRSGRYYHCTVSCPFNCAGQVNNLAKATQLERSELGPLIPEPYSFRQVPCASGLWCPDLQNVDNTTHLAVTIKQDDTHTQSPYGNRSSQDVHSILLLSLEVRGISEHYNYLKKTSETFCKFPLGLLL